MVLVAALLAIFGIAPQTAGLEGTVTGTLTLNGVAITITHVYASAQPGFFDKKTEDIRVLFSDVPLADADRADVFALTHLARDGKARILEVVVNGSGQPISGALYARDFDGQVSVTGMHRFERDRLDRTRIAGRMVVDPPQEFMKVTFAYDLRFSAPIPRPPTAAEQASALASPPARAAAAYIAALVRGDRRAFAATMTTDAAAAFEGDDGADRFDRLRDDTPPGTRLVEVTPQTDGSVLVHVEGLRKEDGMTVGFTLRVVQVGDAWRIGK